ncbi:Periplasmic binding protein domain protein [Neomoorella glycerini]|uniref:Periplasmic binding protein domain protein n=1 Tax=Neomoorella glycerini TaxID=55779 RepID=A0A6I5ZSE3_9FIRM|nr:sugar-binding protein [Moorella glycerini]QGP92904.1 Periplasmic binding protein domain protein [Moorella glycerini]
MLSKKRIIALLFMLAMIATMIAGCGQKSNQQSNSATGSKDKQLRLVFVTPLIGHPVWLVAKEGFDDAAKKFGFQGDWVGPQGIDANAMIQQIENAIASKADGIITMALNPEAFQPVLEKAQKAGIPVVIVNSDAPNAPRLAYIGTDEKNLGTIGAKEIIKKLNGTPAKVITMQSTMDAKVANKMREAYEEELKKTPGTEILARESDNSDMMVAVQKFQNLLRTYPQANVIIGVAAEVGPAAAKVVEEMGLKDKVTIVAIDDMKETVDYIKSGVIYGTLTQNFYRMGYQAAQLLVENIKEGKKPAQQVIDSGTIFVTKDNLDTYKEQMKKW